MNTEAVNVIECRNVWKIFGAGAKESLRAVRARRLDKEEVRNEFNCVVGVAGVSFTVREGEIFCIMGLSGSGKSTLIRHINRLIEPTDGQIMIEGEDINALSQRELRRLRACKIGMVFQNMALMPHKTVRDNVAFALEVRGVAKKERHDIAERTLESVELKGWGDSYPDELSGGMQQRVGLARAISADPQILLMDEPFSALDPLIRRQLQDQFISLARRMKKTTLFITHDLDEAIRIGNRIGIMKDGMLVQIGTPEEIVTAPVDGYVADFVAGISNLHLVTARKVMEPLDSDDVPVADCPVASPDDDLNALVNLSINTVNPIVVKADEKILGVVTKKSLLRGIQGQWETKQEDAS